MQAYAPAMSLTW